MNRIKRLVIGLFFIPLSALSLHTEVYSAPAFGTPDDVTYAQKLWQQLVSERLTGPSQKPETPFFGGAKPHGMILELAYQLITLDGHTGFVVVKRNYDGEGVTEALVAQDRAKYQSSVTVMFQREAGYDVDNQNWFWVKYYPDGQLFQKETNAGATAMAGRIAKGKVREENRGCIYCHSAAGGGDYIFYPEIKKPK